MALQQITTSVQNDGNFSELDLQDIRFGGPLMRIETFRCSQPTGNFGVTAAGTTSLAIAGNDHLTEDSNRIFRHVFSVGLADAPKIILEFREIFAEDGSVEIRCRDLDPDSLSYGDVMVARASSNGRSRYQVEYEVRQAEHVTPRLFTSPLLRPLAEHGLVEIGGHVDSLGKAVLHGGGIIEWTAGAHASRERLAEIVRHLRMERYHRWTNNVQRYERFGDFRDKCVHPGTNLRGNAALASEYVIIRPYRSSLIMLGAVFDPDMVPDGSDIAGLERDPKPGVYAPFLSAYLAGIEVYQLGLDKVHSDYGGIPMRHAPGSRLENRAKPVVDSTLLNRALAELAFAFYCEPSDSLQLLATSLGSRR